MAIRCTPFDFNNPFVKKAVWRLADSTPEKPKSSIAESFKDSLDNGSNTAKLADTAKTEVKSLVDSMMTGKKLTGSETATALVKLQGLSNELGRLEKDRKDGKITDQEYKDEESKLLRQFKENFLNETDVEKIKLLQKQVDDRLDLMEERNAAIAAQKAEATKTTVTANAFAKTAEEDSITIAAPVAKKQEAPKPVEAPAVRKTPLSQLEEQNASWKTEGESLNEKSVVALPKDFLGKSGAEIASLLPHISYGEQLKDSLQTLSDIQGKKRSPIGLLEDIRTRQLGSKDSVAFTEITRSVFDLSPSQITAEYKKLQSLPTPKAEETARLEQLRTFYTAVGALMNALRNIAVVDVERQGDFAPETREVDESIYTMEETLDLFFDRKNDGPIADPTLWEKIRGQDSHVVSMDYSDDKTHSKKAEDVKSYSEAGAWEFIRNKGVTYKEGVATYNPEAFVKSLNFYLFLGKIRAATSKDYETLRNLPPLRVEDLDTLRKNPNLALYKEAIQLGMAQSLDNKKPPEAPSANPLDITAEIAEAAALTPEERIEAQERLKAYQIATLGALINTEEGVVEVGADVGVPLTKDGRLSVHAGIRGNTYHQVLELHAGADMQVIRSDRVTVNIGGGASINPEGTAKLAVEAGADIGLGKKGTEHTFNIDFGASVGLNPKTLGLGLGAYLGVSRDLQAVLARKTEKRLEVSSQNIAQALADYQAEMKKEGFSAEKQASMMASMEASIKEMAGRQGIDDMKGLQFGAAGLALVFVPGLNMVVPVPYLNLYIKGKPYAMYETAGIDLDAQAKKQLEEACKTTISSHTIEVYKSGSLLNSPEGGRRMGAAEVDIELEDRKLEKMNTALLSQGMKLEMEKDGKLRLDISNVRGNADIYTDPKSGLETYAEGGHTYLNVGTTDHLAIKRIDEWSMSKRDNQYQNVKIYISNTLECDPETIRKTTDKHLHFESFEGRGQLYTGTTEIRDQGAYTKGSEAAQTDLSRESTFASESALTEAGLKTMLISEDFGPRKEALKALREVTRAKQTAELTADQKAAIETAVSRIMGNETTRQEYKRISVEGTAKELLAALKKDAPELNLNNEMVLTSFLQKIMEASTITLDRSDQSKFEHAIAWNKKRVTEKLAARFGLDETTAGRMAQAWMDRWSNQGNLTATPIEKGSSVTIEVGTEGINGSRTSTWQNEGNLLGIVDINNLTASGLTTADAQLLKSKYDAEIQQSIQKNPYTLQLGIALLDRSDLLFSSQEMAALNSMARGGEKNEAVQAKFQGILKDLYSAKGSWTSPDGSITIKSHLSSQFGLYEKCLNFTEVSKNTLEMSVTIPPETQAVGTQTREFLLAHTGVNFIGLGAAVGIRVPEEKTPPPSKQTPHGGSEGGLGDEQDNNYNAGDQAPDATGATGN